MTPSSATIVLVTFDGSAPLSIVRDSYLSVNIDTGSLYQDFTFTDPVLVQLTANLVRAAPMQLRIGGGAADNTWFTGVGGARGPCAIPGVPKIDVCVSAESWDEIIAFAATTGVELVWDLQAGSTRLPTNEWDSTNAAALFAHVAASGRGPAAWQLGNEMEDWYKRTPPNNLTGAQLSGDYSKLKSLLAVIPSLSQVVNGPDACCEERRAMLADFAAAVAQHAPRSVDAVTVHAYPIARAPDNSCLPALYTSKAAMATLVPALQLYAQQADALVRAGAPLILGETATSAHGGCANLSNAFVAGFTFMFELGHVAEVPGFVQLNRQDLAGWSSETGPSNYALLGHAGWSNGTVLTHPDYYTALLWKSLVGTRVLASSFSSPDDPVGVNASWDSHVWCAAAGAAAPGAVVVTFVNISPGAVSLTLPSPLAGLPLEVYLLTAPGSAGGGDTGGDPPAALFDNAVALNGNVLATAADGSLPQWPLPGVRVVGPVVIPPWSYGFVVVPGAEVRACVV